MHITSDVERVGSAVDSFGAKWDSLKPLPSQKVPWFSVDNKCCTFHLAIKKWGVRAHLNCSIYGSNCSITAETVFTEPCNVRQMLDEVMEWARPRLSRIGGRVLLHHEEH